MDDPIAILDVRAIAFPMPVTHQAGLGVLVDASQRIVTRYEPP